MWLLGLTLSCAVDDEPVGDVDPVDSDTGSIPAVPTGSTAETAEPPVGDLDVATFIPDWAPPKNIQRIVIVGDSITVGTGLKDLSQRWADRLISDPGHPDGDLTGRFGSLEVLDLSRPGGSVWQAVAQGLDDIDETWGFPVTGGTLVVGTLGTADILFGLGTDRAHEFFLENLGAYSDALQDPALFPDGAWLYLSNIYDQSDGQGRILGCWDDNDRSWLFDQYTRANDASLLLAQERGFAWVDSRGHFLGHGTRFWDPSYVHYDPQQPELWFLDCWHPDPVGHHEMRRLFLAAIDGVPFPE